MLLIWPYVVGYVESLFSTLQEAHIELSQNEASPLQCSMWNQRKDRYVPN